MAKARGLIFSLFDVALARQVPYNAFFMDLPVPSFVSHSGLLAASVDMWSPHDGFVCMVTEIVHVFDSGYFNERGAFHTAVDLCNGLNMAKYTFQMIIDITKSK